MDTGRAEDYKKYLDKAEMLLEPKDYEDHPTAYEERFDLIEEMDHSQLKEVFDKALAGDAESQSLIGIVYDGGVKLPKDQAKAAYWFKQAADQHHSFALYQLGNYYYEGLGLDQNLFLAKDCLEEAIELGVDASDAEDILEYIQFEIDDTKDEPETMRQSHRVEPSFENEEALRSRDGFAAELEAETEKRKMVFEKLWKTAIEGSAIAMKSLADAFDKQRDEAEFAKEAAYWYLKAAEQGDARSQWKTAEYYRDGRVVPKDIDKAVFWCEKAAEQGVERAMNMLAEAYETGEGKEQNYAKAELWYSNAKKSAEKPKLFMDHHAFKTAEMGLARIKQHEEALKKAQEQEKKKQAELKQIAEEERARKEKEDKLRREKYNNARDISLEVGAMLTVLAFIAFIFFFRYVGAGKTKGFMGVILNAVGIIGLFATGSAGFGMFFEALISLGVIGLIGGGIYALVVMTTLAEYPFMITYSLYAAAAVCAIMLLKIIIKRIWARRYR